MFFFFFLGGGGGCLDSAVGRNDGYCSDGRCCRGRESMPAVENNFSAFTGIVDLSYQPPL